MIKKEGGRERGQSLPCKTQSNHSKVRHFKYNLKKKKKNTSAPPLCSAKSHLLVHQTKDISYIRNERPWHSTPLGV